MVQEHEVLIQGIRQFGFYRVEFEGGISGTDKFGGTGDKIINETTAEGRVGLGEDKILGFGKAFVKCLSGDEVEQFDFVEEVVVIPDGQRTDFVELQPGDSITFFGGESLQDLVVTSNFEISTQPGLATPSMDVTNESQRDIVLTINVIVDANVIDQFTAELKSGQTISVSADIDIGLQDGEIDDKEICLEIEGVGAR